MPTDLSESDLSPSCAKARDGLSSWLESASFSPVTLNGKPANGILRCNDAEKDAKLKTIFDAMNCNPNDFTNGIFRIIGPDRLPISSDTIPSKLIPLRIVEGSPDISGRAMDLTKMTEFKGLIKVGPGVDILVVRQTT